ncbi:MAG: arginine--tRNA ligase [Clostridia bacterium]|nr:arginine--tRNA ligase [Clostridia bacterium]
MEIKNEKKELIASFINIEGVTQEEIYALITVPQDSEMGDFALPCFRFAKALRKAPVMIAQELRDAILVKDHPFTAVEAVNGYLNFKFNKLEKAKKTLNAVLSMGTDYGTSQEGKGKTVCIDYSSINIAKPFHIGHLSTTVIGGALYRMYKKLGYNAVGINHLGDWGTQFGKLIVAFKKWGDREDLESRGIYALNEIYVKFHQEAEKDPTLDDLARKYFKLIEDGDKEALDLFYWFKEITLREVKKIYERLDINFDSYNGEAFYNDKMTPVLEELKEKGLTTISDGAEIVDLAEYGMSPCLLVKADGATLYATRDLAAAFYRKHTYDFWKCLYVVAYQQNLHFKQVFKVLELMGKDWAKDLVHVPFGMVSLEDGTMSTRKGKVVWLEDVLNKSVEKSLEIISKKNETLANKEAVAEMVGTGAVVFFALSNSRIKDIVFGYDKVLNFDGETGPYCQYTNARCNSVLRKLGNVEEYLKEPLTDEELAGIDNKESDALITLISNFGSVLNDAVARYEPSIVTRYVVDVAQSFNKFYLENRILNADESQKRARVALVYATHVVLKEGLRLIGVQTPEEM